MRKLCIVLVGILGALNGFADLPARPNIVLILGDPIMGMKGTYQWELFDLEKDPDEIDNLYANPEYSAVRERMEKKLRKLIRQLDAPVDAPGLM